MLLKQGQALNHALIAAVVVLVMLMVLLILVLREVRSDSANHGPRHRSQYPSADFVSDEATTGAAGQRRS
jgi:hypothetical protein